MVRARRHVSKAPSGPTCQWESLMGQRVRAAQAEPEHLPR
jgi:hypothetical protein